MRPPPQRLRSCRPVSEDPSEHGRELTLTDNAPIKRLCRLPLRIERLAGRDCTPCSSRFQCTRSKQEPHIISLQTGDLHEALQTMRKRQTTEEFRKSYAPRAGIESTHAQAIRRSGLRRTRYRGLVKTRLQHIITAVAINLLRIASWANGTPLALVARNKSLREKAL